MPGAEKSPIEMAIDAAAWLGGILVGPGSRLFPFYIVTTILIAYIVYRRARPEETFLAWIVPGEVYLHRSQLLDVKLWLTGRALAALGVFNSVLLRSLVALLVMSLIGGGSAPESTWNPVLVGLLIVVANDFGVYWVHRLHHEAPALWPFHAVHHSAEVLTPITVYRKHPIYDLLSGSVRSIILGALQGVLLGLFVGTVALAEIAGINTFYVLFNALGSNLRHSHIWLSYGPVLERILISPAQHQIHHSSALQHHNRNYGEVFAAWDWMFGTLYVPERREELAFGLADARGNRLPQPHGTLRQALIVPVVESWNALARRRPSRQVEEHEAPVPGTIPSP